MKIAVVGSGAAALGVLDFFSTQSFQPDITLIDRAKAAAAVPLGSWTPDSIRVLYDRIRAEYGTCFPPPKTDFGNAPAKRMIEGWGRVWDSGYYGGLTSIWGLSSIPFSVRDFEGWPFDRAELDPHYASIARRIGIAGERDALNEWVGEDFVNRPPIAITPLIAMLTKAINSRGPGRTFRFVAGVSRLAVETRAEEPNSCTSCGECMIGCTRRAMYSTVTDVESWRRSGLIARVVSGRALSIDGQPPHVIAESPGGRRESLGPFDRVYLCAGCIDTTEIAMRTLGQSQGPRIVDNSAYTFPLLYTGPALPRSYDQVGYFGLSNAGVTAIPLRRGHSAQLQIYPVIDHLWRYFTPHTLWTAVEPLARRLRRRILIARIFLHGEHSQAYAIRVEGDGPAKLSLAHSGRPLRRIPDLWADFRRSLEGSGFSVPIRPMLQRTSSHYAASLPLGKGPIAIDASLTPGVYLCDSSIFPTAPAASPTFTIMANARRVAALSLRN
jgi:hypothetical protein